jgi:hypothetical protein
MPTKPLSDELAQQALDVYEQHGDYVTAAKSLGVAKQTFRDRVKNAQVRGMTPTKLVRAFQQSETGHAVLVIPDSHSPFMHPDAVAFLTEAKSRLRPTRSVHLGDEVDNHALSQYDPDPDGDSAGVELHKAKEQLQELYALFREMRVCESNHGVRPFKRAYRSGIPRVWLKDYAQALEAPEGWRWADKWEIDGVVYQHGEGFGGENAHSKWAAVNGKSTVIGHIHSHAGIKFIKNEYRQIWGMNCGCLIDATTYAFKYAKLTPHKQVLGVGFVDNGSPFYFPMRLDGNGRWTGKW